MVTASSATLTFRIEPDLKESPCIAAVEEREISPTCLRYCFAAIAGGSVLILRPHEGCLVRVARKPKTYKC
jgi:hypothetical protein